MRDALGHLGLRPMLGGEFRAVGYRGLSGPRL